MFINNSILFFKMNSKIRVRNVLMSSGNFTKEVVIVTKEKKEIYESSPEGVTISLKEPKKGNITNDEINLLPDFR